MNKKGFTIIEMILSVFIFTFLAGGLFNTYSSYTNNVTEISTLIKNQIIKTQQQGLNMSPAQKYSIEGKGDNQYPYLKIDNNSIEYIETINDDNKAIVRKRNFINTLKTPINISTNLEDNTVYFNKSGLPCKKDGTVLSSYSISITNTDNSVHKTLTSNSIGNISVSN